jgi:hypothetical protein
VLESDIGEARFRPAHDFLLGQIGVTPQRKGDILADRHRIEQRGALK